MSSNTKAESHHQILTRRKLLYGMGVTAAAVPLVKLLAACGSSDDGTPGMDDIVDPGAWAIGGTQSMTALKDYPNPFVTGLGAVCAVTCETMLGPCYAVTLEREDISEGESGLPARLAFLIVDEACKPIQGATVDIWHCGPDGLYSGDDSSDVCTFGDARARAARWYRGVQTTDKNGRVNFNTCFPGWYRGRTIHIHLTVRLANQEYVTTQLIFDDALANEIVATQPLYDTRGQRDTTNSTDIVVSQSGSDHVFETRRMADGALLAWKTLVIRSSLSTPICHHGLDDGLPPPNGDGGMGPPPGWDGGMP
ncbi:dioxygenase family protein [Hyalangium versicolor]|uniref:dioxygenase family protein n=1 Tax=Hyalangium versicolor TaxID=2861190 RepID=UPI001CCF0F06|nr:protocatechuate 3,4-dioxygenase [Hyalangium versicolor]